MDLSRKYVVDIQPKLTNFISIKRLIEISNQVLEYLSQFALLIKMIETAINRLKEGKRVYLS